MIKKAVILDNARQTDFEGLKWAKNYLEHNDLLDSIDMLKKNKRKIAFPRLLAALNKPELIDQIECNSKGHIVFKWHDAKHKTMFILKWS